ncbi:LysR family transcriptional regulator substrate-binding protein [Ensifer sp. ENS05]|nr:LysR family transcriptional regulator substrate-binding protein [Ensifer sp. ENS05]
MLGFVPVWEILTEVQRRIGRSGSCDVGLSAEVARSVAGKAARTIRIGTVYPATTGVLPAFLARIGRKFPDVALHVRSGSTSDIIRRLENGQIAQIGRHICRRRRGNSK